MARMTQITMGLAMMSLFALPGCLIMEPQEPRPTEQAPFILGTDSLVINAPWLTGDQVVAVHVEAESATSCTGHFLAITQSQRGIGAALLDTNGTSYFWVDFPLAVASAGPLRVGFYGSGSIVGASLDVEPFQGTRWLWFILPDLVDDPKGLFGGLHLSMQCPGAQIVEVLGGHDLDVLHWRSRSDATALVFSQGAWAGLSDPAVAQVPKNGQGIASVYLRDTGAAVGESPEGPWVPEEGFSLRALEPGEHTIRLASKGTSLAVLASAGPVDWGTVLRPV